MDTEAKYLSESSYCVAEPEFEPALVAQTFMFLTVLSGTGVLCCVRLVETLWVACQAPLSMEFSRQEY